MKTSGCIRLRRGAWAIVPFLAAVSAVFFTWFGLPGPGAMANNEPQFTSEFRFKECEEFETVGVNPYFILKPGYRLVLKGTEDGEKIRAVITVLSQTEKVYVPGIGTVRTRVVEEKEWVDGELVELSRNFFAICDETNDVVYFGEDVFIFNPDGSISHEGEWRAGVDGALPGIIMPGTFLLGSRYFQEIAPGVALDRAEHVKMGFNVKVPAGSFKDCVKVHETSPLDPDAESKKIYCPGVGLVIDDVLKLVKFGFNIADH
ncbi:MAG: hypothetical protein ACREP8_09335 [Candidatus Binatia bacterium]